VDSGPPAARDLRAAITVIAAAAVIFMIGFIAALAAAVLSLTRPHHAAAAGAPWAVGTAEHVAVVGLAVGIGALVLVWPGFKAMGRAGRPRAQRPGPWHLDSLLAADQDPGQVGHPEHGWPDAADDWLGPLRPPAGAPRRLGDRSPAPDLPWPSAYFDAGWRPDPVAGPPPPPAIDFDVDYPTGPLPAIRDWFEPSAGCESAPRPEQTAS
jgi:hypothetical protein